MAQPGRSIDFGGNLLLRERNVGDHGRRARGSAVAGGVSTGTLAALGWAIVSLYLALVAANEWMVFTQFRAQTTPELQADVAAAFLARGTRMVSVELIALLVAGLVVINRRASAEGDVDRRALTVLLVSYLPLALYSMGVAGALLGGWNVDVWVLPAATASSRDIAATIGEALPVLLEPLSTGRAIATAGAAILFAVLQRRLCGMPLRASLATAVLFGVVLSLARLAA
jgi:hypothetical protein